MTPAQPAAVRAAGHATTMATVGRRESDRAELRTVSGPDWPAYLRGHSGLPGPRANLELVQAVADEGDAARFHALIATDDEYLVMCGTVGLGCLLAVGWEEVRGLHALATDSRWRVREAVAMALQRLGDADVDRLFHLVEG